MKLVIILSCVIGVTVAAKIPFFHSSPNARILSQNFDQNPGSYKFGFEQSDGTKHEQEGSLKVGQKDETLFVKGSYSWVGPDGVTYKIDYTAGEDGFDPDITQGPGGRVPADILGSLAG